MKFQDLVVREQEQYLVRKLPQHFKYEAASIIRHTFIVYARSYIDILTNLHFPPLISVTANQVPQTITAVIPKTTVITSLYVYMLHLPSC